MGLHPSIQALLYGEAREGESVGCIQDKSKPLIFAMARLDKVKNLTGLAGEAGPFEVMFIGPPRAHLIVCCLLHVPHCNVT